MSSSFPKRLKELRIQFKMTQADLAKKLGLVRSSIANYETGRSSPDFELLDKLSSVFNVSTDYLLGKDAENIYEDFKNNNLSKKDKTNIDSFLKNAEVLFMDVCEEDRDMIYKTLCEIYFESKAINKEKFNPYKNRKN